MKLNKLSIYLGVIGFLSASVNLYAQKVVRYDLHIKDTLVNFTGKTKRAKIIMHGKLSKIIHNSSLLFKKIPKNFYATRYHSLIIDKKTLNENFEISAITEDNIIMAINHKKYPLYGIQFHPESIKTSFGNVIFKNFLKN